MGPPPIFFVVGAFGTGKTTLAPLVAMRLPECFVLDVDWLLESLSALVGQDLHVWEPGWPALGDVWFAVANIAACGGRSTVMFTACEPDELERRRPRDLIGESHTLLLESPDEVIRARLAARDDWRKEWTADSLNDASNFRTLGLPTLHTDEMTPEEAADFIVNELLPQA